MDGGMVVTNKEIAHTLYTFIAFTSLTGPHTL